MGDAYNRATVYVDAAKTDAAVGVSSGKKSSGRREPRNASSGRRGPSSSSKKGSPSKRRPSAGAARRNTGADGAIAGAFWRNGYDQVHKFLYTDSKETLKELASLFDARASIENDYAKAVDRLSARKFGDSASGSTLTAINAIKADLSSLAKQKRELAARLNKGLSVTVTKFKDEHKNHKKKRLAGFQKIMTSYDRGIRDMTTARTKYYKLSSDADAAVYNFIQGQQKPNAAALEAKAKKANRLAVQAEGRYRVLVEQTYSLQGTCLEALAELYTELEDMQYQHYDFIKQTLEEYIGLDEEQMTVTKNRCMMSSRVINGLDGHNDVAGFVAENGPKQSKDTPISFQAYPRQHQMTDASDAHITVGGYGSYVNTVGADGAGVYDGATGKQMKAIGSYQAQDTGELSFKEGDVITVLDQDESGWWAAEVDGVQGLVPSNYLA